MTPEKKPEPAAESALTDLDLNAIEAVSHDTRQLVRVFQAIAKGGLSDEHWPDREADLFKFFKRAIDPLNRVINVFNQYGSIQPVRLLGHPYRSWHEAILQVSLMFDRSWKCGPGETAHLTEANCESVRTAGDEWLELELGLEMEWTRILRAVGSSRGADGGMSGARAKKRPRPPARRGWIYGDDACSTYNLRPTTLSDIKKRMKDADPSSIEEALSGHHLLKITTLEKCLHKQGRLRR